MSRCPYFLKCENERSGCIQTSESLHNICHRYIDYESRDISVRSPKRIIRNLCIPELEGRLNPDGSPCADRNQDMTEFEAFNLMMLNKDGITENGEL